MDARIYISSEQPGCARATIYINQNLKIPRPNEKISRREQITCEKQLKPEIAQSHFAVERFWEQQGIAVGAIRLEPDWIPFAPNATGLTGKPAIRLYRRCDGNQ